MTKKKTTKKDSAGQEPDFESSLEELESLVEALESGELSLAESLERFKRGITLSKQCHEMLDQARQSVEMLGDPDEESSAQAFDPPRS